MPGTVEDLVELCRAEIGAPQPPNVRVLRGNLGKTLFEIGHDGSAFIGKVSKTHSRAGTFDLMQRVWNAGMRPPSRLIISQPVAWFPDHGLLLQRKAEGDNVLDLVKNRSPRSVAAMELAGEWLHRMHSLDVDLPVASDLVSKLDRCSAELEHPRATALLMDIRDRLNTTETAPSHGDFHPQNVFVSAEGVVTAIDFDTLSVREPAFDVAWFETQLATMGYHAMGGFRATRELRRRFRTCAPVVPEERVQLHIRFALVRSLHYDLCILKLKDRSHVEDFLDAAEHGLE